MTTTMDTETGLPFTIPPDIRERADALKRRLLAHEAMSMQQLSDAIGLPYEFVATAIAITVVLKQGISVTIDPTAMPRSH